jgi:hypothetical protein
MPNIEVAYSENDMYYTNSGYCKVDANGVANQPGVGITQKECVDNKAAYDSLVKTSDDDSKSQEKYTNMKNLYNRELIYTFNLIIGVCALLYYIYLNQNVLPSMETIKQAATNAAASVSSSAKDAGIGANVVPK